MTARGTAMGVFHGKQHWKMLEQHGKTIGKPLDISMGIWELMVILKVFHEEMGFFVGDISLEFFSRWDFNKKNK